MDFDIERSKKALSDYLLHPKKVDGEGHSLRLVIHKTADGKKCLEYAPLGKGEATLRFFGAGDASFKNVVKFVLDSKVIDELTVTEKSMLFEKAKSYNADHNWLRSFMRVDTSRIAEKIFGRSSIPNFAEWPYPRELNEKVKAGDKEAVSRLLKENRVKALPFDAGKTALHVAAESGNDEMVKLLIGAAAQSLNARDEISGETALHLAIRNGKEKIVNLLLDCKELDLSIQDKYQTSALHLAAQSEMKGLVPRILQKNPSATLLNQKDHTGMTPLAIATLKNNEEAALCLLDSPLVSEETRKEARHNAHYDRNPAIYTAFLATDPRPLQDAMLLVLEAKSIANLEMGETKESIMKMRARQLDVLKRLTQMPAVQKHLRDENGRSPLHRAVNSGAVDVVALFLDGTSSIANLTDHKGKTALHEAIEYNKTAMALHLIQNPHIALNVADNNGSTVLHDAIRYGNWTVAKAIARAEAPRTFALNHQDIEGATSLMLALSQTEPDLELVRLLLMNTTADLSLKDREGRTLLHRLIMFQSRPETKEVFETVFQAILQKQKKLLNQPDNTGQTPLHIAIQSGSEHTLHHLLNTPGILVNVADSQGNTPLHLAAMRGNAQKVEWLLQTNLVEERVKVAAYDLAKRFNNREVMKLLKPH